MTLKNRTHPPVVTPEVVETHATASVLLHAESADPLAIIEDVGDMPIEPDEFIVDISMEDEAYSLRMAGFTTKQIANKFTRYLKRRVTPKEVDQMISAVGRDNVARTADQLPFQAQLQLDRIEEAVKAIWPACQDGNLAAIDRLVRLQQRTCQILGLEAPDVAVQLRLGTPDGIDLESLSTEELQTYLSLQKKVSSAAKQRVIGAVSSARGG